MVTTDPGLTRWDRVQAALPYLLVLLPALFALLREWRLEVLVLALFAVAWHWLMVTSHPGWIARPVVLIAYFAVLLAVIGVLVRIDNVFTVTGLGAFVQCFALLPGLWAYGGVAVTVGVLIAARPQLGRTPVELLGSFVVGVLAASTVGLVIKAISDQNDQRKMMIAELRETSAKLVALADDNANLQAQLLTRAREAGVLEERQRMAREIHDTVAQGLTAILTQLEAVGDVPPPARARLDTVQAMARESLTEARRSVQALRPASLQHEGALATVLEKLAATWSRNTGVPAAVSITGDPRPLHAEVETALLRVAQEALANVSKHASAGRVGLTLSYMDDVVALDVRDDGAGFAPAAASHGEGFGLVAMRQRVTRLAGSFAIESAPGQGTGVSATVPAIPADPDPGP
ncbi:sensor histidine kinase [Nonomuraea ferruginea]|uniref:Oxygen sensor histidine kinase NreB n=1 Tax=Nonomuraea ferruginea TaxID=46174 RepID=A0ABT4SYY5_9ACTN|nr:sensor histidine kinase [Nonomuraea ferruginea]MDA0642463.1 sensor histidine kinase [Nonomuraea ferruginea]